MKIVLYNEKDVLCNCSSVTGQWSLLRYPLKVVLLAPFLWDQVFVLKLSFISLDMDLRECNRSVNNFFFWDTKRKVQVMNHLNAFLYQISF